MANLIETREVKDGVVYIKGEIAYSYVRGYHLTVKLNSPYKGDYEVLVTKGGDKGQPSFETHVSSYILSAKDADQAELEEVALMLVQRLKQSHPNTIFKGLS